MTEPVARVRRGMTRLALLVAWRDYVRTVRRRGFVVGTLLLPLSIALVIGLSAAVRDGAGAGMPADTLPVRLVVVAETPADLTPGLAIAPGLELVTRAEADARAAAGTLPTWYLVPETWPASPAVARYATPELDVGLAGAEREAAELATLEAVLRTALTAGVPLDDAARARIVVPVALETRTIEGAAVSQLSTAASYLVPFAFALLFVISIFVTSGYLLQSVTEEKENRVVEIVLSSVPPLPLMAGKLIGLGAAGLTQVVIWASTVLLALPFISDRLGGLGDVAPSPVVIALAVLYFVLGYLAFGAIFAAIGALAPGTREAQQYSGFLGFFAVVPLVVSGLLLGETGSGLTWVLALIPLTAPATMLQVLALAPEVQWPMVIASLGALLVWVSLATIASGRVFRATLLLYGVRPSGRQVVDAILDRGPSGRRSSRGSGGTTAG